MAKEKQVRAIEHRVEVSSGEDLPRIVGYAAVFNSRTDLGFFTESIAPGAFTASLERQDDVAALIDHNPTLIIGRTPDTLELSEDDHGLRYVIQPTDTQRAKDLVKDIEAGNIRHSSFGFYIEREELDRSGDKPHFTILEARLFDVSPVTFPAYKDTEVSIERSLTAESLEERIRAAEGADYSADLELRKRKLKLLAI